MKRALVNAAVEALWERLIVERSVLTAGELGQLRTARAAAHSQGGHLTLEQQLLGVLGARLEPLREELRARARSCGRCQSCFLAAPPHGTCPTCGQAGSSFQATSTSGILAPQRPASEATVLLPPRAPQGPGYSSSSGSGAFARPSGTGAFARPSGTGTFARPSGTGAFARPSGASGFGASPAPGAFPGSGSYAAQPGGYPAHMQNSLLNSQTSRFRSTSSNSRPSGSKSHAGAAASVGSGTGLEPGTQIGNYVVVAELGRGGMGAVYQVRNGFGQIQALKVLHSLSGSKQQRFRTEIEIMAKLCHPNVIQVHDSGMIGEYPYYVMDYVEGSDLKELIKNRALKPREGVALLTQVVRAVGYAHTCGVLHRDLKPGNIIVDQSLTRAYVLDFGLAKVVNSEGNLTRTGTALGTPYYMPPELAAGRHGEVDGRADVYSLGVILYELLVGTPPFTAASNNELMRKIAKERPASLRSQGVPAALDKVAMRALAKRPEQRYPNAEAMAADLEGWLNAPESTVPLGLKLAAGGMAALVLVLALTLVGMLTEGEEPEPQPHTTVEQVDPPQEPTPPPLDPDPVPEPDPDPDPDPGTETPPRPDTPPLATPPTVDPPPPQPRERSAPPARVGLTDDPLKPLPAKLPDAQISSPIRGSTNVHLGLSAGQTGLTLNLEVPPGTDRIWVRVRGSLEDVDLYLRQGQEVLLDPRRADLAARSAARDEDLQWTDGSPLPLEPGPYSLAVHRPRPRGESLRITLALLFLKAGGAAPRPLADIRGLPFHVQGAQPALVKCLDTYDLDPEQALRAFPRLAADVDPALGVVRAEWLLDLGRYDDARAVAEGVLERATDDLRARYVLAHCDYVRGDYAAAIERLNALVRENPNLYQPVLLLTRCLLESGDAKQAANLGMVVAKRDPSRLGLQGLALLAMHDDGRKDGWELFSTKFLQDNNLDDESMRIGLGELLRRKRPELVVDWCESHRTVWGQKAEQPLTLSLLEAEALLMLGRKADAERLCAALEPQLRLAEHRAKLAALRARAQAAADGESPQAR